MLLCYLRDLAVPADDQAIEGLALHDAAKLPQSYRRGWEMLDRLRGFGFVTFFK